MRVFDTTSAYAAIGRLAALGNLLDWMLLEVFLAASGEPLSAGSGQVTDRLLDKAKKAVRVDTDIDDGQRESVRAALRSVRQTMNRRGDAIHATYMVDVATGGLIRVRLKKRVSAPLTEQVSAEFLEKIGGDILDLVCELRDVLEAVYPTRGWRPGSTFAPLRATRVEVLGDSPRHDADV